MKNFPRTSIIMPVYNTANQVIRSIESVLAQTDPDFELLIINDCSPDNAHTVITEYLEQKQDERIRYLVNDKNLGLAGTRNRGIAETNGHWLAYLDSDDAYKPDFLQTMHAHITNEIDVIVCAHDVVYADGSTRYRKYAKSGTYEGSEAMLDLLKFNFSPFAWDKLYRRSAVEGKLFPILNRVEDSGYNLAVFKEVRMVKVIDDSLNLYTVNPESITWGSVPPLEQTYKYMDYLKNTLGVHRGTFNEQSSLAVAWSFAFLHSAQNALRTDPVLYKKHIDLCDEAIRWNIVFKAIVAKPVFGLAAACFKLSPKTYGKIYSFYVKRAYGI